MVAAMRTTVAVAVGCLVADLGFGWCVMDVVGFEIHRSRDADLLHLHRLRPRN